ncbi:glycosyltransferase family protein [Mucilaginibacter glaciei]|uniref:Uncharacterized protein n=1 Tax=Mucilaginibacter glaciei TaxID=2772109 RepID=A0A926NZT3_9SPHI|nr:hypothetical protein [Mucilaginibacter glaciei]MBD1394699.1 hypothetical protein [Mucilaginibacter glaciei]
MKRVLIISNKLTIGGAEKLLVELAVFAQKNNIQPTVLILDNYQHQYYDSILQGKGIKVVHTRIRPIKHFRAPLKMMHSAWWAIKLKYFAQKYYDSVHTIGLYNVEKVFDTITHRHRYFWNVNNSIQYFNMEYSYQQEIFGNGEDTIVSINKYQHGELYQQYGDAIKAKIVLSKLFIDDTN